MPQTCSVDGCKSRKEKDCKKSFFRIPVDEEQRKKWVAAINRKDWSPTPYSRICSDHFLLGHPSKNPSHQDYAPSLRLQPKHRNVFAPCSTSSSPPCTCTPPSVLAPTSPTPSSDQNKRYLSDVDAAEALLHMSKRQRVTKDEFGEDKKENKGAKFKESCCCHLAVVEIQAENRLLREEVRKMQVQMTELEVQNRNLEMEKASALLRLEESKGMVKMLNNELFLLKFGAEIVTSRLKQSLLGK